MIGHMVVINPDGSIIKTKLTVAPSYALLKKALNGGYIEMVPLFNTYEDNDCIVYCDEEGKIKGLPYNQKATMEWIKSQLKNYHRTIDDLLFGPIIILYGDQSFMAAQ